MMVWVSFLLLSEEEDDRVRNVGEEVMIQSVELVGPLRVVVLHGMDVMFVRVCGFVMVFGKGATTACLLSFLIEKKQDALG
jgi:hypothetical protein